MRYSTARKKLIHMLPPFLFELWQDRAAIGTLEIDGDQQLQGFLDGEWRYYSVGEATNTYIDTYIHTYVYIYIYI